MVANVTEDGAGTNRGQARSYINQSSLKPLKITRLLKWQNLLQLLVVVALYLGIQAYHKRNTVSGFAPSLYGTLLDGSAFDPDLYKGRSYMVHFWATWCSVCRLEQGSISGIAEDYPIITIASQSGTNEEVAKFVKDQGLHFPVLVDNNGQWAKSFGVQAYPTSFIVNGEGKIRFVEVGYTTELGLRSRLSFSQ